jgi:hypothetical protein
MMLDALPAIQSDGTATAPEALEAEERAAIRIEQALTALRRTANQA